MLPAETYLVPQQGPEQNCTKGPAHDRANTQSNDFGPGPTAGWLREREGQHDRVHGEAGWQEGDTSIEKATGGTHDEGHQTCHTEAKLGHDRLKQHTLAAGANHGQDNAKTEKGDLRIDREDAGKRCVHGDVQPASKSVLRSILPGLATIAIQKIMCRLPVIENLVAVQNWRLDCRCDVDCK